MQTALITTLLVAIAAPAAAQEFRYTAMARAAVATHQSQSEREIERRLQELERERERLERERERARDQADRDRDRARAREQAEREKARARDRNGNTEETERLTRTLRIGTTGELHLTNISGDIVISRGGGADAQVEIIKTARGQTSEDAREMLKLVEIDVVERPSRAEITTRYPHGDDARRGGRRNINVSVAFNVTVPAGTRVRANSISGLVSAKDIRGDAVLKSVSGTVRLANGGGACTAESISGNVEILDSSLDGSITASSASGTIALRRVKARRIAAKSISGGVILEAAEGATVEGKSISGNVQLQGGLARNSRYELGSHSGNVSVAVPGGAGFEVQASSFSGPVRSEIPFTSQDPEPARGRFGRSLRGVVGDGSTVLHLSTFSGSIAILKR